MAVDENRAQLARVLRFWQGRGRADDDKFKPSDILYIRDRFTPTDEQRISGAVAKGPLPLPAGQIWLLGPPNTEDEPTLWPIATIELAEQQGALKMGIRVATFSVTKADGLRVDGWRFETAEAKDGPRPFAHCQRIVSWTLDKGTLLSPFPTEKPAPGPEEVAAARLRDVPQTWPAFPLRSSTLAGLALAFIVAVNGRGLAQQAITEDTNLGGNALGDLRGDIDSLALDLG